MIAEAEEASQRLELESDLDSRHSGLGARGSGLGWGIDEADGDEAPGPSCVLLSTTRSAATYISAIMEL